jgi:hypothetical protein
VDEDVVVVLAAVLELPSSPEQAGTAAATRSKPREARSVVFIARLYT